MKITITPLQTARPKQGAVGYMKGYFLMAFLVLLTYSLKQWSVASWSFGSCFLCSHSKVNLWTRGWWGQYLSSFGESTSDFIKPSPRPSRPSCIQNETYAEKRDRYIPGMCTIGWPSTAPFSNGRQGGLEKITQWFYMIGKFCRAEKAMSTSCLLTALQQDRSTLHPLCWVWHQQLGCQHKGADGPREGSGLCLTLDGTVRKVSDFWASPCSHWAGDTQSYPKLTPSIGMGRMFPLPAPHSALPLHWTQGCRFPIPWRISPWH